MMAARRATSDTKIVHRTTSDPREEPGALAAHAGICAGGEEKSSSLPRPSRRAISCVLLLAKRQSQSNLILSTIKRYILECGNEWPLQLSLHALNDFIGLFPRHGWLVASTLDQGCKDIGNGQYSNDVGYAGGTECVGISTSIEIFVMMPDCIKHLRGNTGIPLQHFVAGRGMGFD